MKKYEKPVVKITAFLNEDVITASGVTGGLVVSNFKQGENKINF